VWDTEAVTGRDKVTGWPLSACVCTTTNTVKVDVS
jgi:hypothetical protein